MERSDARILRDIRTRLEVLIITLMVATLLLLANVIMLAAWETRYRKFKDGIQDTFRDEQPTSRPLQEDLGPRW
ncbi:MAG: hypothetical protein ACQESR_15365 [Planctomycetota bacterium]